MQSVTGMYHEYETINEALGSTEQGTRTVEVQGITQHSDEVIDLEPNSAYVSCDQDTLDSEANIAYMSTK